MRFLYLALGIIGSLGGGIFSKRWALNGDLTSLLLAAAFYCLLGTGSWFFFLREGKEISRLVPIWLLCQMLTGVGVGLVLFHEALTLQHSIGLALAIGAVMLLL